MPRHAAIADVRVLAGLGAVAQHDLRGVSTPRDDAAAGATGEVPPRTQLVLRDMHLDERVPHDDHAVSDLRREQKGLPGISDAGAHELVDDVGDLIGERDFDLYLEGHMIISRGRHLFDHGSECRGKRAVRAQAREEPNAFGAVDRDRDEHDGVTLLAGTDMHTLRVWTCPECRAKLVTRNLSHSCVRRTAREFFAGKPKAGVALAKAFIAEARKLGPVTLHPVKTRIALMVDVRFAAIYRINEAAIRGHLWLTERLDVEAPWLVKIEPLGKRDVLYHFELSATKPIDDKLRALLQRSYAIGRREHLNEKEQVSR